MAEINLTDNVLKLTLGNIVQQFTEEELQKEMPVFMQDIDAETKELVDTYQDYLSKGNFSEAESYRNANPILERVIWDSFKANAFMAYASFIYMYARNHSQQCVISETVPPEGNEDDIIGQVEGDIWFRIDGFKDGVTNTTPFQKQADGTYKEFAVAPKLEFATNEDIEEVYDDNTTELTNPESLINNENLKSFKNKVSNEFKENFLVANDEIDNKIENLTQEFTKETENIKMNLGTQCIFSLSGTTLTITPIK